MFRSALAAAALAMALTLALTSCVRLAASHRSGDMPDSEAAALARILKAGP